jgi:hypothetical protein
VFHYKWYFIVFLTHIRVLLNSITTWEKHNIPHQRVNGTGALCFYMYLNTKASLINTGRQATLQASHVRQIAGALVSVYIFLDISKILDI